MTKPTAKEIVGPASKVLTIAARIAAIVPEAAAAAVVGGLLGDTAGIAKGYLERKQQRMAARVEAINREVINNRLANVEEQLEVTEEQVDLAIHVFGKALGDDEDSKERYYGALLELVLRDQIETQTLKVLVSAIEALAKIELDEFVYVCPPSKWSDRWTFEPKRIYEEGAPKTRKPPYQYIFVNRLTGVAFVDFELENEGREYSTIRDLEEGIRLPELNYGLSEYARTFLDAVNMSPPEARG